MSHLASSQQLLHDTLAGGVVRDAQRFVLDVLAKARGIDFDGGLWDGFVQAGVAGRPRVTAELLARRFGTSAQGGRARGRRTHRQRVRSAAHRRDLHVFQHLDLLSGTGYEMLCLNDYVADVVVCCFNPKGYLCESAFPVRRLQTPLTFLQ